MGRILVASYLVRYPLGGMASYVLQYLVGLKRLGHAVVFVERAHYANACFDPVRQIQSDDPGQGLRVATELLHRFGVDDGWCFIDYSGEHYGMTPGELRTQFASCDVFIDMGAHGSWQEESATAGCRILIDGEPGYNQIRMADPASNPFGGAAYDHYVTCGLNIGSERSSAPSAGHHWHHMVHPVVPELYDVIPPVANSPFTTVMNWQSHAPIRYRGRAHGQKDVEFAKFAALPSLVDAAMEISVAGESVPFAELKESGWRVRNAHEVTASYDTFHRYIDDSCGEFAVCKNVFVDLHTGWFSDRSSAYLAHGRPVVIQDTGFSEHLPTGQGLFAVKSSEEAVDAIRSIRREYDFHSRQARLIAEEHLSATVVLRQLTNLAGL